MIGTVLETLRGGGVVMIPLIMCCAVLWYCLTYRFLTLQRGTRLPMSSIVLRALAGHPVAGRLGRAADQAVEAVESRTLARSEALSASLLEAEAHLEPYRGTIQSVVVVAPLLGLLGTVSGMIDMFDSLQDMALFSQSGGIAAGIAKALFSTQMGLLVAVPGLIGARLLEARQEQLKGELQQLKSLLCHHYGLEA